MDEDVETFLGLFTQGTESDKVNRCNLAFLSPSQAYDPRNPDKLIPLPADFVGWLQSHPHLDVGKPEPVTVGGVGGSRVDVMVASIPVRHQVNCPFGPCVPIVPFELHGRSEPYPYLEEDAGQMTILEVGGRTVIIDRPRTSSAACDIQRFRPSIQELLGSIEFVST